MNVKKIRKNKKYRKTSEMYILLRDALRGLIYEKNKSEENYEKND